MGAGDSGTASELEGKAPDGAVIGAIAALSGSVSGSRLGSVATASGSAGLGGAGWDGVALALSFSVRTKVRSR